MAVIHNPFPTLRGLSWPLSKTPQFSTLTVTPVSGRGEVSIPLQAYPTFKYTLTLNYLKGSEADAQSDYFLLFDHFCACQGSALAFPFWDRYDNTANQSVFGFGDGVDVNFQLFKQYGQGASVVQLLSGTPMIFVNGNPLPASSFLINNTGQVSFYTPPTAGAALTWSGSFYIACKYAADTLDQLQLLQDRLWDCSSLSIRSVLL